MSALLSLLSRCLLSIEEAIVVKGCVFTPHARAHAGHAPPAPWLEDRRRHKWRQACASAATAAQVAMCAALLREAVPWTYVDDATTPLRKEDFIERFGLTDGASDLLAGVPDEHSFVIYYGAGDAAARRAHASDSALTPMWGLCSSVVAAEDEVLQCTVSSVRVYRSGPTVRRRREDEKTKKEKGSDTALSHAFALVDLQVTVPAQIPAAAPAPALEEPRHPLARLNRLAARVIEALSSTPRNVPFALPVNKKEHEDYYEMITKPMCLETMLLKARKAEYGSAAAVAADLSLLRDNCRTYCAEAFPTLVEDAEALLLQGLALMDKLGLRDGDGGGGGGHSASAWSLATSAGRNGLPAVAAALPQDAFSKTPRRVTVCIPLSANYSPFLIRPALYTKAVRSKAGYHREGRVVMVVEEGGQRTTFRGAIVGAKPPRPDGCVSTCMCYFFLSF